MEEKKDSRPDLESGKEAIPLYLYLKRMQITKKFGNYKRFNIQMYLFYLSLLAN